MGGGQGELGDGLEGKGRLDDNDMTCQDGDNILCRAPF
jgi:hypothetical protein